MEMKQAVVMDQHGTFEFKNVSPGSYTLRGNVMSQEVRLGAIQTLDVGDDHIRNLVVTLNPGSDSRYAQDRGPGADGFLRLPVQRFAKSLGLRR
jgi:hypothetical protein